MKVVGIGTPRTLELRLKCCELGVWREALRQAHGAEHGRVSAAPDTPSPLLHLSRLHQEAGERHREDQPFVVTGPTSVLAPLVRRAARTALENYVAEASAFISDGAALSSDRVRAALDTASAWTATLLALHRVEGEPAASEAG
jgi:hypothetical protein